MFKKKFIVLRLTSNKHSSSFQLEQVKHYCLICLTRSRHSSFNFWCLL